ncbi:MAG: glycosyltransferase family 2 protein, partial [Clostridia bacterium]
RVIDAQDEKIADSFADIRKRVVYKEGEKLTKDLVITNFVTGCAMMIKTDIAKKAIPFQTEVVHDQWLAIFASMHGDFYKMKNPLISYRQHGTNQTGIMLGVKTKEDYLNLRIRQFLEKTRALKARLCDCEDVQKFLSDYEYWLLARERFFIKPNKKDKDIIKKYQNFGKHHVLFDTTLPFVPKFLFPLFLSLIKKLANNGKI